jgi:hypothetical protein
MSIVLVDLGPYRSYIFFVYFKGTGYFGQQFLQFMRPISTLQAYFHILYILSPHNGAKCFFVLFYLSPQSFFNVFSNHTSSIPANTGLSKLL